MPVYYSIKKADRTVRAILVIKENTNSYTFEGIAKCNPTDEWDETKGVKLARARALLKFKRFEKERAELISQEFEYGFKQYLKLQGKQKHLSKVIESLKDEIDSFKQ